MYKLICWVNIILIMYRSHLDFEFFVFFSICYYALKWYVGHVYHRGKYIKSVS